MTSTPQPRGALIGTGLLHLAAYWYLVAHFGVWALGIGAFVIAILLNLIHLLVTRDK